MSKVLILCCAILNVPCLYILKKRYPPVWLVVQCLVAGVCSIPFLIAESMHSSTTVIMPVIWCLFLMVWIIISLFCIKVYSRDYTGEKVNPNRYAMLLQSDQYEILISEMQEDYLNGRFGEKEIEKLFPECHPKKINGFFLYLIVYGEIHPKFRSFLCNELVESNDIGRYAPSDLRKMINGDSCKE